MALGGAGEGFRKAEIQPPPTFGVRKPVRARRRLDHARGLPAVGMA
jgi:hypothetical protein